MASVVCHKLPFIELRQKLVAIRRTIRARLIVLTNAALIQPIFFHFYDFNTRLLRSYVSRKVVLMKFIMSVGSFPSSV